MKVVNLLKLKRQQDKTAITLLVGNFDGFHIGHQHLLNEAKSTANTNQSYLAVLDLGYTGLSKGLTVQSYITPEPALLSLLQQYGVTSYDHMSKEMIANLDEFFHEYLKDIVVDHVVLDQSLQNDAFSQALMRICAQHRIEILTVPPVELNKFPVDQALIRTSIVAGNIEQVQALLGRPYSITGTVVHGEKMGRKLGFPTLNLGDVEAYIMPKPGVYFGVVGIYQDGSITDYHHVLISAGYRPAVQGNGYLIEAHILNFSGDLYGHTISVSFLQFMREERNFSSLDALIDQMEKDKQAAEKLIPSF